MTALFFQTLASSAFLAGIWLWDISFPAKLAVLGSFVSLFIFVQYQLVEILGLLLERVTLIESRLRIIERSLELSRTQPESMESAFKLVVEEMNSEAKTKEFQDRIASLSPAVIDTLAILGALLCSCALAWLWVSLLTRRGF